MTFHVAVCDWKLLVDHVIYVDNKQSMRFVKVTNLLRAVSDTQICQGIPNQLAASECGCHVATVVSVVECVKFLLSNGMPYVLTERFNQESVEKYFGQQSSIGRKRRKENEFH